MIPADLLDLLCCPATRQPLALAEDEILRKLNARLANQASRPQNAVGEQKATPLEAALVRADGAVAYPVRDGIPVLLLDEAIPVD